MWLDRVPMMRGAFEFAAAGVVPGGTLRARHSTPRHSTPAATSSHQPTKLEGALCGVGASSSVLIGGGGGGGGWGWVGAAGTKANLEYLAPVVNWAEGIGTVGKHLLVSSTHPRAILSHPHSPPPVGWLAGWLVGWLC